MNDEPKDTSELDGLKAKLSDVMDELKDAKRKLRAASEIKPEDLTAAEERADKLAAELAEATKANKLLATERDKAVKALETESGAARNYALEAELAGAIAEGNVLPAFVPALKAMLQQQAKADLIDGKYAVQIGDKPAREFVTAFLDSDDGKAFRAAPVNGGGGASGGGKGEPSKTVARSAFDAMGPAERMAFIKGGGKAVDVAA